MTPTPHRIAQTSTEVKRQHRKNGPLLNERQRKQLERELELNKRVTYAREAEERRKAAKKKRTEKEAKEAAARKQLGVGLATQLIGYSHTQAQLKNGMEAFLGLNKKRNDDEKRKKELEITRKLEEAVSNLEKEPWDDDEEDEDKDLGLPQSNASLGEQWADDDLDDDDLDDDSLLEAHNLFMSDSAEETTTNVPPPPPLHATQVTPGPPLASITPKPGPVKEDLDFTRTHGPINKTVEATLDRLAGSLIEFLSQDVSLKTPEWDPALGLLHKLNPVGLPPHRLRIKVGCVVTLLRDLHTSSQLSKSQHLRILRSENDRVECLVLDGRLKGTKTFLTRVPFCAKYRNLDQYPFQRTQFPICVAINYTSSQPPRDTPQAVFKLSSIPDRILPPISYRKTTLPELRAKPQVNLNPDFKLPGLPASKSTLSNISNTTAADTSSKTPALPAPTDCWDDFFESSTQISREIASEAKPKVIGTNTTSIATSLSNVDDLPPMSTQDLNFSLDDLDDEPIHSVPNQPKLETTPMASKIIPTALPERSPCPQTHKTTQVAPVSPRVEPLAVSLKCDPIMTSTHTPTRASAVTNSIRPLMSNKKIAGKCWNPGPFVTGLDAELAKLRASQLPKSMSVANAKRRATAAPSKTHAPPSKKQYAVESHPTLASKPAATTATNTSFDDFIMSTQDAASFFDDDDNLSFGSPPIAV
ncbi:hypothetical protein GGP41_004578 [Bipolaris sorokiniana]|uniref:ATP-dependent DNA helicase n=1 Tax=Cochliobolus sativus TaxID=45130 RepID=A0A8H6DSL6_COCSA|nr:hypothetical protein GGP41_004578 [Bipolaris sorokiniana]